MSSAGGERRRFVGASMRLVWQWVWDENYAGVVAAGYDDLNPAHVGLFRHPTLDGQRLTDIAHQMQVTKQSVHELVGHLEARGYLVRVPDPDDRRVRVVQLTARGRRLETVIRAHARRADQQIAGILGPRRFAALQQSLEDLIAQLVPTEPG